MPGASTSAATSGATKRRAQAVLRIVEASRQKSVSGAPQVVGIMALDAVILEPTKKGPCGTPDLFVFVVRAQHLPRYAISALAETSSTAPAATAVRCRASERTLVPSASSHCG